MQQGHLKILRIRIRLTSKPSFKMTEYNRYPFVAADILSSSARIADSFIEEKKVEESVLTHSQQSTADNT